MCSPKRCGGLGVKDLELFNRVLVGKWRWWFISEGRSLWVKILKSIGGGFRRQEGDARGGQHAMSGWWKDVLKIIGGSEGEWFCKRLHKIVGDGSIRLFGRMFGWGNNPYSVCFRGFTNCVRISWVQWLQMVAGELTVGLGSFDGDAIFLRGRFRWSVT